MRIIQGAKIILWRGQPGNNTQVKSRKMTRKFVGESRNECMEHRNNMKNISPERAQKQD